MAETITSAYAEPFFLGDTYTAWVTDQASPDTTVVAPSDGLSLPQSTIYVFDESSLASAGIGYIETSLGPQTITWTSTSLGQLNGVTGGLGVILVNAVIQQIRVVSFVGNDDWWRTWLCSTSGTGDSAEDPREWLAYVQLTLRGVGNYWTVSMRPDGHVRIKNEGSTDATIVWVDGEVPVLLGHATTAIALSGSSYVDGVYTPTHCMFLQSRSGDTGWQDEVGGEAGTEFHDGVVDWLGDGSTKLRRGYTLARLPAYAGAVVSDVTPMYPIESATTRRKQPIASATPADVSMQWSVLEFIACAMGQRIAVAHGTFQSLVASGGSYDLCYFSPKTREGKAVHSTAYWSQRMDRPGVEVLFYDRDTTT